MGERDPSRKILAFIPLPPFLCLHPRIQDKRRILVERVAPRVLLPFARKLCSPRRNARGAARSTERGAAKLACCAVPIRFVHKAPLTIAQRFIAGFGGVMWTKSRQGRQERQECFFRPCGTWFGHPSVFPAMNRWAIFTTIFRSVVNIRDRLACFAVPSFATLHFQSARLLRRLCEKSACGGKQPSRL
jgi:hypothetical protein